MAWDIRGKQVLITGATSGIGLEASVQLARLGAKVAMVGRDPVKTERCVAEVRSRSGSAEVSSFLGDFSSQASIRALAEQVRAHLPALHVLVNNAGGVNKKRELTVDGLESTFATNHLGYYLLTRLLLDLVEKSAPARIVNVASIGHHRGTIDFEDLGFERGGYGIMQAYGRSKLGNVLFTAELARRLEGRGVTVNCLHPGAVATPIWSGAPLWIRPLLKLMEWVTMISPEEGAQTIVHLAASPDVEGQTGLYFEKNQPVKPSREARDPTVAKRLWDVSATLTGLGP